jgi:hypothetical protein
MVFVSAWYLRARFQFHFPGCLQPVLPMVAVWLCTLVCLAGCMGANRLPLTGDLPVAAPLASHAGEAIQIVVGPVEVDNGTPIGMVLVGTFGPRVYNTVFTSGIAAFIIPAEHTLQPGYLALIVAVDSARGEASIILIPSRTTSTQNRVAPVRVSR